MWCIVRVALRGCLRAAWATVTCHAEGTVGRAPSAQLPQARRLFVVGVVGVEAGGWAGEECPRRDDSRFRNGEALLRQSFNQAYPLSGDKPVRLLVHRGAAIIMYPGSPRFL